MAAKECKEGWGGRGRVSFYFDGKGEEEEHPSELDNDLDSSEDEWGKKEKMGRTRIRRRIPRRLGNF